MKTVLLVSACAVALTATPAAAQFQKVEPAPDTWASIWVGGLINPGRLYDPGSTSNWDFGSAFAGGLGLHRRVGNGLSLGLDASFSPATFERRDEADQLIESGTARLATTMLTGRLRYGGGDAFGMYLTGGAGALIYGMPSLGRWDPDLALLTGAGLEYRASARRTLFVEWGRYWTFHQREGVEDNSSKMSQLRAGVRFGF